MYIYTKYEQINLQLSVPVYKTFFLICVCVKSVIVRTSQRIDMQILLPCHRRICKSRIMQIIDLYIWHLYVKVVLMTVTCLLKCWSATVNETIYKSAAMETKQCLGNSSRKINHVKQILVVTKLCQKIKGKLFTNKKEVIINVKRLTSGNNHQKSNIITFAPKRK